MKRINYHYDIEYINFNYYPQGEEYKECKRCHRVLENNEYFYKLNTVYKTLKSGIVMKYVYTRNTCKYCKADYDKKRRIKCKKKK